MDNAFPRLYKQSFSGEQSENDCLPLPFQQFKKWVDRYLPFSPTNMGYCFQFSLIFNDISVKWLLNDSHMHQIICEYDSIFIVVLYLLMRLTLYIEPVK